MHHPVRELGKPTVPSPENRLQSEDWERNSEENRPPRSHVNRGPGVYKRYR
jgi:hypothetical protein